MVYIDPTHNYLHTCKFPYHTKARGANSTTFEKRRMIVKVKNYLLFRGYRMFQIILECSRSFQNVADYSIMLQIILKCSRLFQNILDHSRISWIFPEYPGSFQNVPDHSRMSQIILECSKYIITQPTHPPITVFGLKNKTFLLRCYGLDFAPIK